MSDGKLQGHGPDLGTLDEPVTDTIMRDLTMVGNKMMCVLNPRKANIQTLKNWDLWGPLVLCLTLATLLSWFAPYEQKSLVFASVFVIICCGATVRGSRRPRRERAPAWRNPAVLTHAPPRLQVVTVNALLLGGNISFFQSVCVLGYCIFPLNIASVICLIGGPIVWRVIVVAVCFFWSTSASLGTCRRWPVQRPPPLPWPEAKRLPHTYPAQALWGSSFRPTAGRWLSSRSSCSIRALAGSSSSPRARRRPQQLSCQSYPRPRRVLLVGVVQVRSADGARRATYGRERKRRAGRAHRSRSLPLARSVVLSAPCVMRGLNCVLVVMVRLFCVVLLLLLCVCDVIGVLCGVVV